MNKMLETRKYTFTVEGETEKWYLLWLKKLLNECPERKNNVTIEVKVQKSPMRFVKSVNPKATPKIVHICDIESNDDEHVKNFKEILSELKDAKTQKKIIYELGYSNFTFELWMILHKKNCNGVLSNRSQYLSHINQAFGEKFENLDQYKIEKNFARCLGKLTLEDVRVAIKRAKYIMEQNKNDGKRIEQYKGFKYYKDNPALTIYQVI